MMSGEAVSIFEVLFFSGYDSRVTYFDFTKIATLFVTNFILFIMAKNILQFGFKDSTE